MGESGGNLNQPRGYQTGAGTQTAALAIGGYNPNALAIVENYDGTSWTEIATWATNRSEGGASGTQTAAIAAGGNTGPGGATANTETWDGSSWTEVNNLNAAKDNVQNTIGLYNAALFAGGYIPGSDRTVDTESWNGTSWTEVNNLNTARNLMAEQGTQTAGLVAGGTTGTLSTAHEQWDGTSWTETTDINTARNRLAGSGTQTSAIIAGGNTGSSTGKTEFWNGTSWTEVNDMASARTLGGNGTPAGTSSVTLVAGSSNPGYSAATEEFTAADFQIKTVTTS